MPTAEPFLYCISATVADGQTLEAVEAAVLAEIDRLTQDGISEPDFAKARAQLRARFVYDGDSVTDLAHQLGYFETIASWRAWPEMAARLERLTLAQVEAAARKYLRADNRTIGWFEPRASEAEAAQAAENSAAGTEAGASVHE